MIKVMLILLLSSFLPGSMSAQENEITRLRVMLQMENLPDRQAEIALHLMEAFRDLHIDSARHYAQLAQKWAIQSDVPLWMARAGMAMGRVQELEGRFREAVQQYLEVEQMLRTRNAGTDDLWFQLHYNLILCYSNTGPLDQALIHYDSAYSHLSSDDIGQKIQLNNAMGIMYSEVGHNHLAIKYFQHNLDIARQAQDSRAKAMAHYNIGLEYTTLQMADSGIAHFKKALPYFLENRSSDYLATLYTGLGENLLRQKKYREGLSYMEEAEKICLDLGHDGLACGDYALVAHAYWELNELDRALLFSQEALEVLDNTQEYSSQQRALKVLVEVYRLKGDYQKALEYSRRLMDLKDTVSRVEHQRALVSMEQKYRARERETQLENQSLELKLREDRIMRLRLQIALAVAGGILMLLLLFLIWRILRQKMQLNERLRELDQKKARFFANISHEFRTPLTLIMGPLARAMEDVRNRVVKRDLQLAYDNAGRMSKLIDEVLDLSKLEEGMLELKNAEVLLHRQVQRLFSAYESYADMRGIRMEIKNNLPENKIWWLDPDKFNKIVN
ncbi:MAG: HAMP domain-containing sensor histidine kinase, partial [Saprospiraceae bacterium]|nr:HAMP domain-containing sensor histidine kinase [Saprospiraceae bacterium]